MRESSIRLALMATLFAGFTAAQAASAQVAGTAIGPRKVSAPLAFVNACQRYAWLCSKQWRTAEPLAPERVLDVARKINRRVNFAITPVTDIQNYGKTDYWALPRRGRGDCEDIALEKYLMLLDAGVDARDLSIAIALDGRRQNHAVLVLHHSSGDLVLDNLTSRIRPLQRAGYRFLAIQARDDKRTWDAATVPPAAGGDFGHRWGQTASFTQERFSPGHE